MRHLDSPVVRRLQEIVEIDNILMNTFMCRVYVVRLHLRNIKIFYVCHILSRSENTKHVDRENGRQGVNLMRRFCHCNECQFAFFLCMKSVQLVSSDFNFNCCSYHALKSVGVENLFKLNVIHVAN